MPENPRSRLPLPTDTLPETEERLAVVRQRYQDGTQIHHIADRHHGESILAWRHRLAVFVERNGITELVQAMQAVRLTELAAYLIAVLPREQQGPALRNRGAGHAIVS